MPELLSNIPPQPGLGIETVASQGLVCDQVKSVKDRAANPEAGVPVKCCYDLRLGIRSAMEVSDKLRQAYIEAGLELSHCVLLEANLCR
jgi:hypothetical protein